MTSMDRRGDDLKIASGIMALLLVTGIAQAATLTVDDSGGAGYTNIQDAINAANPGDTIEVREGMYPSNIVINKESLRLHGINNNTTMIRGIGDDSVIKIMADSVRIDGFSIFNGSRCVDILASNNSYIYNNNIYDCKSGIWIELGGNDISMFNNNIFNNMYYGIYSRSKNANISNNRIHNNSDTGISTGIGDIIYSNEIYNNSKIGIYLEFSNNNSIYSNNIYNNRYGIQVYASKYNSILNNEIHYNIHDGIWIFSVQIYIGYVKYSEENHIENNTFEHNRNGIVLLDTRDNYIRYNNFIENIAAPDTGSGSFYTIIFSYNMPSRILLNDNSKNVVDIRGQNMWDYNYWSDYSGGDLNGDGIGDMQYSFTTGKDDHPLVRPNGRISESPNGDIISRYAGSDGIMQRSEAVQAVMDYFSGTITKQQAIEVIMAYFNR